MNSSATTRTAVLPRGTEIPMPSRPASRLVARRLEEVDALVIPEQMTPNATRNVTKCTPNALCVYSAAPAACGWLVTSSR